MKRKQQCGFTLVEIIVAIVIMSIIAIGLVQFITDSAAGYSVTATRNQVSSSGRVIIDRMAMDLRNALPESVRTTTVRTTSVANSYYAGDQCIEFIPVVAATRYINPVFRPAAATTSSFEVVEFLQPELGALPWNDYYAVIYPTSTSDVYLDEPFGQTEAIAAVTVADATGGDGKHDLTPTRIGGHRFKRPSPEERLYLVPEPVSYCITGTRLYRYEGYGFHATQLFPRNVDGSCTGTCLPATTTDGRSLITDQLDNSALNDPGGLQAFEVDAASRRRNSVIRLDLNFQQDGEQVRMNHEILLQMTP